MARIHRQTGSLHDLIGKIGDGSIDNLDDINAFKKDYASAAAQIKEHNKAAVVQELEDLRNKVQALSTDFDIKLKERTDLIEKKKRDIENDLARLYAMQGNIFESVWAAIKKYSLRRRKAHLETHFDEEVRKPLRSLEAEISGLTEKLKKDEANLDSLVERRAWSELSKLETIKSILRENNHLYLGAVGEENVLAELKKLPDSFFIINDFRKTFYPPIYNRKLDDRIHSIQIDHLVCGPTGFFIIETKNWSESSSESVDFFSPVKQVQRLNFAMFVCLNQGVESGQLQSFVSHWGDQKISPINIVATLHPAPPQEFQYVKVLSFNVVRSHIESSKRLFSENNVNDLERFLLTMVEQ